MKATVKYNNDFVTSAYDIETLKKVKKFRPEALVLYKGEGKEKEPVCAIGVSGGKLLQFGYSTYSLYLPRAFTLYVVSQHIWHNKHKRQNGGAQGGA